MRGRERRDHFDFSITEILKPRSSITSLKRKQIQ